MAKQKQSDRVNDFILTGAQERALLNVQTVLPDIKDKLAKVISEEELRTFLLNRIEAALHKVYANAVCDTIDVYKGQPLSAVK